MLPKPTLFEQTAAECDRLRADNEALRKALAGMLGVFDPVATHVTFAGGALDEAKRAIVTARNALRSYPATGESK